MLLGMLDATSSEPSVQGGRWEGGGGSFSCTSALHEYLPRAPGTKNNWGWPVPHYPHHHHHHHQHLGALGRKCLGLSPGRRLVGGGGGGLRGPNSAGHSRGIVQSAEVRCRLWMSGGEGGGWGGFAVQTPAAGWIKQPYHWIRPPALRLANTRGRPWGLRSSQRGPGDLMVPPVPHTMIALKLQQFQSTPKKIDLRCLIFPMRFGPSYGPPSKGGGGRE